MVTKDMVIDGLRKVMDPEIGLNIYDLGFIYKIDITPEGKIDIDMTLTVPGCPMSAFLVSQVKQNLNQIEGVKEVNVQLVFEPKWSPEKLTEQGKQELRSRGYNI